MPYLDSPILIRNGTVVNADATVDADVLISNGKIVQVGNNIEPTEDVINIDATGKFLLPGGIDTHTHLDFEFMGAVTKDDFYHGTRAGVIGGTTMVIDFVIPKKGQSLLEAFDIWMNKADGKAVCDFSFHVAVTYWNKQVQKEMEILCRDHGVNSFKMFMAYKDSFMIDDSDLFHVFRTCERLGALPMVHAENGHIIKENTSLLLKKGTTGPIGHQLSRPENVEAEATNRACVIAENAGSAVYIVHVMSKSAADIISRKRESGNRRVFGEALAAGLGVTFPTNADYDTQAAYVMGPPIRGDPETPHALMLYLSDATLMTTGTDNCTFDTFQKHLGVGDFTKIPNGVNGLEDRMSVIWNNGVKTGALTVQQFVQVTSTNAAKIFNIYPKKGCIYPGADADVLVWDGNSERVISAHTHHHNNNFNIFEGMKVVGNPDIVLVNGRICYQKATDTIDTVRGWGKYVPKPCFSPAVYSE